MVGWTCAITAQSISIVKRIIRAWLFCKRVSSRTLESLNVSNRFIPSYKHWMSHFKANPSNPSNSIHLGAVFVFPESARCHWSLVTQKYHWSLKNSFNTRKFWCKASISIDHTRSLLHPTLTSYKRYRSGMFILLVDWEDGRFSFTGSRSKILSLCQGWSYWIKRCRTL